MSTLTFAETMTQARSVETPVKAGLGHYINVAATIALVLAVAVAGWFATMQLNTPGKSDSNFALFSSTPMAESSPVSGLALCDVEPMPTEKAMDILINPYRSMNVDPDTSGNYSTWQWLAERDGRTGQPPRDGMITDGPRSDLASDDLETALAFGDLYLSCLQNGTRSQLFTLMDPLFVHAYLRDQLPLFASEEDAYEIIEELLNEPANTVWNQEFMIEYLEDRTIQINRNPDYLYMDTSSVIKQWSYSAIVIAPVVIRDASGTVVFETDFGGFPHTNNGRAMDYARNVWIVQSDFDGQWYIYGIFTP